MADYKVPVLEKFIWQESVKDKDVSTSPTSPTKGDRYIVAAEGEFDYMEYLSNALAQAAYVTTGGGVLSNASLEDEDMSSIADWSDGDTGTGDSSQVTFDSKSCMKLDTGGTIGGVASRLKNVGAFGARTVLSVGTYCSALGTQAQGDYVLLNVGKGVAPMLYLQFCTDGLFIEGAAGYAEVGTDLVVVGSWQEWTFDLDWTAKTLSVYLNGILKGSGIDFNRGGAAGVNGDIRWRQFSVTTANRIFYIDWEKTGASTVANPNFPLLLAYSESTIKTQGSYSLKGIAEITDSNGKNITKTFSVNKNLTGVNKININIYSSRTGSNIKFGIHDTGGTTTELTPNVLAANTWQTVTWDLSAVSDANKNDINTFIITIVNADAANTFYVDDVYYYSGAWDDKLNNIALCTTGGGSPVWEYVAPRTGMKCFVVDEALWYYYNSTAWAIYVSGTNTGDETNARIAAIITAATADTPLDADEWSFRDVVDSVLKKITWTNIKATLKTYFDTIYTIALLGGVKNDGTVNSDNILPNGDFEFWTAGTSVAPDGWTFVGSAVSKELTTIKIGTASCEIVRVTGAAYLYLVPSSLGTKTITYFKGRAFTFGCWAYATVANRVRIGIWDDNTGGTYSSYHTGNSTWQWLTVTATIAAVATTCRVYLYVDTGDTTGWFDGAILSEGASSFAFANKMAAQTLDNLASVAINTSLVSDTDNTDDLGTSAKKWKDGYFAGNIITGGVYTSYQSTGSIATATPTTIFTAVSYRVYLVTMHVGDLGALYTASCFVIDKIVHNLVKGANCNISMSGANVQVTQSSGGAAGVIYSVLRMSTA